MKNSYQGYWFSCEPMSDNKMSSSKWVLLLENKSNNKIHSIGLDNRMTMGELFEMAYQEIEELIDLDKKQ